MPDRYLTVPGEGVHEVGINRSRFRCVVAPVADETGARALVDRLRAEHPTADHTCHAYVLGADAAIRRCDDDGEPGGTAGAPMLRMLLHRGIRDVAAVVTRWFGGTKLGAGGLIRAYGGVVGETLDRVGTVERRRTRTLRVTVGHDRAGRLEHELRAGGLAVLGVHHASRVTIELAVPEAELEEIGARIADATAGTARTETLPG
ncbi:YigZ family protein [Streptomyces calidiresistens]|uniref:DUF1949 domain-containing protein n=1 Tax=Streptomyces calidiresistens TaxID=1485586 RepID=A0A7W3T5L7_9ACTN|nr:YigZ family protein [Streptomyces calidiresistens]MBB0231372.1 DUF1949 domain-containing protein [Streptomyces calidiresistens]